MEAMISFVSIEPQKAQGAAACLVGAGDEAAEVWLARMLLARLIMKSAMTCCVSSTVAPGVWETMTCAAAALGLDEASSTTPGATSKTTSPVPLGVIMAVNTVLAPPVVIATFGASTSFCRV